MSTTKIDENTTNIFYWFFSEKKNTLWLIKLNVYVQKTNFTSQKQYLFGFLFSRNARKTPTDQIHYNFFLLWKQTSHKTLKVADEKNFFSSVYVIDTACFDECFLFHVIIEILFYADLLLSEGFLQVPCVDVLLNKCFGRSPCFMSVISKITLQCC